MASTETTEVEALGSVTVVQRWLARLALVAAAAAVLVAPLVAGVRQSVALVLVGLAGLALTAAGVWWALSHRGLVRRLAVKAGGRGAAHRPGLVHRCPADLGRATGIGAVGAGRGRWPGRAVRWGLPAPGIVHPVGREAGQGRRRLRHLPVAPVRHHLPAVRDPELRDALHPRSRADGGDWVWVTIAALLGIGHWAAGATQCHQRPGRRPSAA
jgi:hypothetical protein